MKKKYFIFGSGSAIAKSLITHIRTNNELVCFSSKKKTKYHYGTKFFNTNYNILNIEKILKKEVNKNYENIFLFFNGISEHDAFYKLKEKNIQKIIKVNFVIPILITNLIVKNFYTSKSNLIYLSSSRALNVDKGISIYSSTKNGICSFVKTMALEYGELSLNFRVISLGLFYGGLEKKISDKIRENIFRRSSIKKNVKISELNRTIQFIIKDKAGNGSTVKCDNGYF